MIIRWCNVQIDEYDLQAETYPNICTHHKLHNTNENSFAMDSKRWWCLLSNNHSILNLREFFHSEKYRGFTQHAAVAILRHSATMG